MSTSGYCPECGEETQGSMIYVNPEFDSDVPWSAVQQIYVCAVCEYSIPAHLAEFSQEISQQEAIRKWLEVYKSASHRREFVLDSD